MIELVVKVLASYLLGSVLGSLLIGRLRGGVDIRMIGSGNAGGTNALRTQGKAFALGVTLIDVVKGWIAARGIAGLAIPMLPPATPAVHAWLPVACASAAILGHIYPLWHGFRGGKGVATLVGTLAGVSPVLLVPLLLTWLIAGVLFGYVSLASMLAASTLPAHAWMLALEPRRPLLAFSVFVAGIVLFTHRANVARLRTGREPRAQRLWLLGARR